jgi:diguanylate cyclase (GGDEF)-like protein
MKVRELLSDRAARPVEWVEPGCNLLDVTLRLKEHNVGAMLVVTTTGEVCGLLSERDIVRAMTRFGSDVCAVLAQDVMTTKLISCTPDDDAVDTLNLMNDKHIRHMPVLEEGRPVAMLSIRDLDYACNTLRRLARTDGLTGLNNRQHFIELLEKEYHKHRRFNTPLTLAMLDIDEFKAINDTHGHDAGDRVLRALGALITGELRTYDVVGRLGGEEFAIAFPGTPMAAARLVCNRLLASIRQLHVRTDDGKISFTASLGLSSASVHAGSAQALLQRADRLLYDAKAQGRDRIVSEHENERTVPRLATA